MHAIHSLKHLNACYMPGTVPSFLKATVLLPTLLVWYQSKLYVPSPLTIGYLRSAASVFHLVVRVVTHITKPVPPAVVTCIREEAVSQLLLHCQLLWFHAHGRWHSTHGLLCQHWLWALLGNQACLPSMLPT